MTSADVTAPLAVSMGDPAGIGLDITLKAWNERAARKLPPFVVFADETALSERAKLLGLDVELALVSSPADATVVFDDALPVISVPAGQTVRPGQPTAGAAQATIGAIERAVSAVSEGAASAVVTNPIAKSVLYEAGFRHPGHTEFLASLASHRQGGQTFLPVMLLASNALRVVPLTIHVPLASVPGLITRELLMDTVRIVDDAMRRDFGITAPRIAVCGLNPHAGENGTMGREEIDVIGPAVQALLEKGIAVTGPHSADTLFHAEARAAYDVAVCMYHDQALIPIKTLAFDTGVNVTLGLPFVRTSPDHGTAFPLAGTGKASAESFIQSCMLARDMAARRTAASRLPA